jgi:hypothetical protein
MRRVLSKSPLLVVLFLIVSVLPLPMSLPAAAQDDNCPEGLVYYPEGEICLLPENVPTDDTAEEPSDDTDDAVDDDLTDEGDDASDEDLSEDQSDGADEDPSDALDDATDEEDVADDVVDDTGDMEDMEEEPVDDMPGTIVNLTLTSYACPALWDPAAKGVDESLAGCTATPGAELSYTILYAGTEQVTVPAPATVDLAGAGISLVAGTWTIQENGGESDPYAACTITAADGSEGETIQQAVPGGSLDVELGDGEALDCDWFSTRELATLVGEGSGAIPSLTVTSGFCPFGIGSYYGHYMWGIEEHKAVCLEDPGAVAYSLLFGETNVSSQTTTDALPVDMVQASSELVTSGTYRLIANVPNPYVSSLGACIVTEVAGSTRYVEQDFFTRDTLTPEIVLELNPGETVACWWFFMDPAVKSGPLLGIDITARVCPYNVPQYSPTEACSISVPEAVFIDYLLNDQGVGSGSFVLTPSTMNVTENGGVPNAGTWTFQVRGMPADWLAPYWYCSGTMIVPGQPDAKARSIDLGTSQVSDLSYAVTVSANQRVHCDVTFAKPVADDYIRLVPVECTQGVDGSTLTPLERASKCTYGAEPTFQILIDDQPVTQQGIEGDAEVMAPLTPGSVKITTTPPTGMSLQAVDCEITNSDQIQTIEPTIGQDGVSVSLEVKAGDDATCTWFFGTTPAATLAGPATGTEPTPTPTSTPETAALNDPSGTGETTETTETAEAPTSPQAPATGGNTGTTGSGTTQAPTSPQAPVTGTSGGTTGSGTTQPSTGATDSDQASSLEIRHWDCPAPITNESAYEDLLYACTPSVDDSSWVIEGLQPGPLQITVGDDATSLVSCGSDGEGNNDVFPAFLPVENGAVTIGILPATTVYCDWFVHP